MAADLKSAFTDFVGLHREAHEKHQAAMTALFTQYRASLNSFLEVARQANHAGMVEMQEATNRQFQEHAAAAERHLVTFKEQFAELTAQQEAAHKRLTEAALVSLNAAAEVRLAAIEDRISGTLSMVEDRLPDKMREGVKQGLDETVALIEALREHAAELTQSIGQVSGNADRQLLAYERWQERANAVQTRLEQMVTDAQSAQSALHASWQTDTAATLESIRAAFTTAARDAQTGYTTLAASMEPLTLTLQQLQATTQEIKTALDIAAARRCRGRGAAGGGWEGVSADELCKCR